MNKESTSSRFVGIAVYVSAGLGISKHMSQSGVGFALVGPRTQGVSGRLEWSREEAARHEVPIGPPQARSEWEFEVQMGVAQN